MSPSIQLIFTRKPYNNLLVAIWLNFLKSVRFSRPRRFSSILQIILRILPQNPLNETLMERLLQRHPLFAQSLHLRGICIRSPIRFNRRRLNVPQTSIFYHQSQTNPSLSNSIARWENLQFMQIFSRRQCCSGSVRAKTGRRRTHNPTSFQPRKNKTPTTR